MRVDGTYMKERVVVTGIGIVSSVGLGKDTFLENLKLGKNAKAPVTMFDGAGFEHDLLCEVKDFQPKSWVKNQNVNNLDRSSQFSVAAARMAIEDSGFAINDIKDADIASVIGTTDGSSQSIEKLTENYFKSDYRVIEQQHLPKMSAQNIALSVAKEFSLTGEATTISTACAAGNYAIGTAFDMIRNGEVEQALCGGSDSVCRKTFAGFYRLGSMASNNCQPFDVNREGMLTGEGSAVLLLESLSSAVKRKAPIYAEISGYAMNCDANHMVAPNLESIADCIRQAHKNSGIDADDIDYICMHGTGTKANDVTEVGAIKKVFGKNIPAVSSIKSTLGHGMGAASAFGAAVCCLAIKHGFLPPTMNIENQDPECDIDVIKNKYRSASPKVLQNNAFAFGGNNSILLLKEFKQLRN